MKMGLKKILLLFLLNLFCVISDSFYFAAFPHNNSISAYIEFEHRSVKLWESQIGSNVSGINFCSFKKIKPVIFFLDNKSFLKVESSDISNKKAKVYSISEIIQNSPFSFPGIPHIIISASKNSSLFRVNANNGSVIYKGNYPDKCNNSTINNTCRTFLGMLNDTLDVGKNEYTILIKSTSGEMCMLQYSEMVPLNQIYTYEEIAPIGDASDQSILRYIIPLNLSDQNKNEIQNYLLYVIQSNLDPYQAPYNIHIFIVTLIIIIFTYMLIRLYIKNKKLKEENERIRKMTHRTDNTNGSANEEMEELKAEESIQLNNLLSLSSRENIDNIDHLKDRTKHLLRDEKGSFVLRDVSENSNSNSFSGSFSERAMKLNFDKNKNLFHADRFVRTFKNIGERIVGSHCFVYKATSIIEDEIYAIKEFSITSQMIDFFADPPLDEVKALSRLSKLKHKNLISYITQWIERKDVDIKENLSNSIEKNGENQINTDGNRLDHSEAIKTNHLIQSLKSSKGPSTPRGEQVVKAETQSHTLFSIFLQMEFSSGEHLKAYFQRRKIIDVKLINSFFIQILNGLHALHKNGVSHNNLKPSNILIENNQEIKLTDFGIYFKPNLIKRKETKGNYNNSKANSSKNFLYLSPEKEFKFKKVTSEKADIYAFGIILFEMISIFDYPQSRIDKIKELKLSHSIPKELKSNYPVYCELISKMINNDPEKRITTLEIYQFKNIKLN